MALALNSLRNKETKPKNITKYLFADVGVPADNIDKIEKSKMFVK